MMTSQAFDSFCEEISRNRNCNRNLVAWAINIFDWINNNGKIPARGRTPATVKNLAEANRIRESLRQQIIEQHKTLILDFARRCADRVLMELLGELCGELVVYGTRAREIRPFNNQSFMEKVYSSIDWDIAVMGELPGRELIVSILQNIQIDRITVPMNCYSVEIYAESLGLRNDPTADITVYCEIMGRVTNEHGSMRFLFKRENVLDLSRHQGNTTGLVESYLSGHAFLPTTVFVQSEACYILGLVDIVVNNSHVQAKLNKAEKARRRLNLLSLPISENDIILYKNMFTGLRSMSVSEIQALLPTRTT